MTDLPSITCMTCGEGLTGTVPEILAWDKAHTHEETTND